MTMPLLGIRSGSVFTRLQHLAELHPALRPGQVIEIVIGENDPFYWETGEWNDAIEKILKDRE